MSRVAQLATFTAKKLDEEKHWFDFQMKLIESLLTTFLELPHVVYRYKKVISSFLPISFSVTICWLPEEFTLLLALSRLQITSS